jgi:hypothetical protein
MAEAKSPSTKDLLLLITGFYLPKSPPSTTADKGDVYWLKDATTNVDRELRESIFNPKWLGSPEDAWGGVRFRDWLIATLFSEIAKRNHDFVAIEEPLLASIDVLSKEFTPDMKGVSPSITESLKSDAGARSLFNALTVGISRHILNNKEVFMVGAGIRRRARFWRTESVAVQADVEFFVPFYELTNSEPTPQPYHAYSVNAGITISHSDGSPIGIDEESKKELIAVRFNMRAPFGTEWVQRPKSDQYHLKTAFDPPVIHIQKKIRENAQSLPSEWHRFPDWE